MIINKDQVKSLLNIMENYGELLYIKEMEGFIKAETNGNTDNRMVFAIGDDGKYSTRGGSR